MGGGNQPLFGDEIRDEEKEEEEEEDESLHSSSMENVEVPWTGNEERRHSWLSNCAASSQPLEPPTPPAQDLSAESSAESSTTMGTFRFKASTSSSTTSSTGASKTPPQKVPRKKTGKKSFVVARAKLLNYRPGSFGGKKSEKFKVPEVTTLLVVGLRGSGKSAVINRIIRVMDAVAAKSCRAPLAGSHEQSGTNFLGEYSICNGSVSLFDTRGFTVSEVVEGMSEPQEWMTGGVRDGQMELRPGDAKYLQEDVKLRGRLVDHMLSKRRDVNFVIFVVNAADFMHKREHDETKAKMKMLFENPFFSFLDDRPILVMTHTDELRDADRMQAPFALAQHFKVPATDQIYDLSSTNDDDEGTTVRDNVVEMLTTALQRADRHLPQKMRVWQSIVRYYDNHISSDPLKFHIKLIVLYLFLVSFMYFCSVLLRTHKSVMNWVDHMADGNTVTINLRWLGKKMRF